MSLPNVEEMGKEFYKLVKARDDSIAQDIRDYDGDDTDLLDHYVIAGEDDYITKTAEQLGKVEIVRVDTVATMGESGGGIRCYTHETYALKDENGDLWIDVELHDELFC